MLYQAGDANAKLRRVQGAFLTEDEVKDVVGFIKKQAEALGETTKADIPVTGGTEGDLSADFDQVTAGPGGSDSDAGDELFGEAKAVVVQAQKASASLLQRRLKVGYARAARLLDLLEEKGIIGPGDGAKPRDVFIKQDGAMDVPAEMNLDSREDDKIAVEE